jgi:hypothetical protein
VNIQSNPDKTWKKSFPPTFCSILLTAKEKKDLHKNQKKKSKSPLCHFQPESHFVQLKKSGKLFCEETKTYFEKKVWH